MQGGEWLHGELQGGKLRRQFSALLFAFHMEKAEPYGEVLPERDLRFQEDNCYKSLKKK